MCGIYGSTKIYSEEIVKAKLTRIAFRGPDFSQSRNIDDKVIIGHNRLSIIDLDVRSNQPLYYRGLWIAFNGEIFNYKTLKKELEDKGHNFLTTSDTEVICAAYLEYKEACVRYFNGMFAFVIYDVQKQVLFGARDRVGKKPLYYTLKDGYFEFASQISAITVENSFRISDLAIQKYLLRGYVEDPYSIYEGISKLRAGYAFHYNVNEREFEDYPYWDIVLPVSTTNLSYEEAKHQMTLLLKDAISIRMVSDVPLGTFLSGGIDSSLITALAASQSSNSVSAFSVKFNERGFDESEHAHAIAKHIGVNHTIIPCNYEEGLEIIQNINYYFDEPFADSSAVPTVLLAKHTKKYITVSLSGDGGDEVFMGYSRYRWIKKLSPFFSLPFSFRKIISHLLELSPNKRHKLISDYLNKVGVNDVIRNALINSDTRIFSNTPNKKTVFEYVLNSKSSNEQKISDLDFKLWLCNDGLVKIDRGSMSASMEVRCPLLDYRIIEFGRSLPLSYKFDGVVQKKILRDILYEYVPKELLDRPKSGFTMPFKEWFRKELKDYVNDTLTIGNLKDIPNLNIAFIQKKIAAHIRGEVNFYSEIWKLIILINWLKMN